MADNQEPVERRFIPDKAKFATQREVTYAIIFIFFLITLNIFLMHGSDNERGTILNTVVNLMLLATGYWIGASKATQDAQTPQPPKEPTQ